MLHQNLSALFHPNTQRSNVNKKKVEEKIYSMHPLVFRVAIKHNVMIIFACNNFLKWINKANANSYGTLLIKKSCCNFQFHHVYITS